MIYIPASFALEDEVLSAEGQGFAINVRLCRNCEYFEREHPTIAGIGYCKFHTNFNTTDGIPVWWLCDENDFCNGEWVE